MSEHLERLLVATWDWGQRMGVRHRRALDLGVALAVALLSFGGLWVQHRLHHADVVVFCVLLPAPLLLRRRSPSLAFGLVAAICLVQWFLSTPQLANAALLVALYWVALEEDLAHGAIAAAVTEGGAIMAAARWSPGDPLRAWAGLSGLTVAATVLGIVVRQRRALVASLHERAAQLELERDREGQMAAAAERARIAREMHDIVAHNLTVMISLADGAEYAMAESPETARAAIGRVSATGRQALVEMRRLLGVLKHEAAEHPLEPQPGLERLDDLVARVTAAGVPVSVDIVGDPRKLAPGVQLAVFRVVQEALTNTLKHAGRPVTASVALCCRADTVALEVLDTGVGHAADDPVFTGRGLRGMRERAAAYGGELVAGPLAAGGWRVHLTLHDEASGGEPPGRSAVPLGELAAHPAQTAEGAVQELGLAALIPTAAAGAGRARSSR
jgi:signal transduction histidine kinase